MTSVAPWTAVVAPALAVAPTLTIALTVTLAVAIAVAVAIAIVRAGAVGGARETEAVSDLVEDVNVVEHSSEVLVARTLSKDWHISQTVHTLVGTGWQSAIDDETSDSIFVVDVVVVRWKASDVHSWKTRTVLVDLVVLAMIWVGTNTLGKSVARIPVAWEK